MKKITKKEIREYIRLGLAQDITAYDFDRAEQLRKAHTLDVIAVSRGVYGMTGGAPPGRERRALRNHRPQ